MERSRGGRALKAIHTLSHALGMQYAVKLHRENTQGANCPPLAWTCSVTVSCLWKSSVLLFHLHYPVRLSEFGQSVSIGFLFVCFNVGIHSCLPQLGLWNFKTFSPRSTAVLNFYLVQNFDISKIKRHLKNLWHSAAKIVFVVGQTECNTQRCVPDFIVECFNFIVFSQIAYSTNTSDFSTELPFEKWVIMPN